MKSVRKLGSRVARNAPRFARSGSQRTIPVCTRPNGRTLPPTLPCRLMVDPPPLTLRAAERYLRKRGNMRKISDLYAAHRRPKPEAVDMTEWPDAQLEGIPCDAEHGACSQ